MPPSSPGRVIERPGPLHAIAEGVVVPAQGLAWRLPGFRGEVERLADHRSGAVSGVGGRASRRRARHHAALIAAVALADPIRAVVR
jgi:hypothetical protein